MNKLKNKAKLIMESFKAQNPHPKIELNYHTPYELLIAVILSAQSTDIAVNKVTKILFKIANTPSGMITLGEEVLKNYIKTIGLFNNKAKNIIKTSKILLEEYENNIPDNLQQLISLPGVGRKTANVILNTIFNQNTMPVDTHVFRVANRMGLSNGKTTEQVEKDLYNVIEENYLKNAHYWLVLHGRYICTAKKPKCLECKLKQYCDYYIKQSNIN